MTCNEWKPEWIAYLYDEMNAGERGVVEAHLADCRSCREQLDQLGRTQQSLRSSSPDVPHAPRIVWVAPSRFKRPAWSFAAGAIAAMLALFGFFAGMRYASPPTVMSPADVAALLEDPAVAATVISRAELQRALDAQQARFDSRLSSLNSRATPDESVLQASITPEEFEEGLARVERRCAADRTRDLEFMLGEISATEQRAGNWIDQTRSETLNALRYVALQSDPRFSER